MPQIIIVALFGLLGIFSRWSLDSIAGKWFELFPIGILGINIIGSFLAGITYVAGTEKTILPAHLAIGLLVGFCGGFTTFSAYSLQSVLYIQKADMVRGIGYLCLSPALGFLGALLGINLSRSLL